MSKNKIALATLILGVSLTFGAANAVPSGPFGYDLQKDLHRNDQQQQQQQQQEQVQPVETYSSYQPATPIPTDAKEFYSFVPIKDLYSDDIDNSMYYPNASINSAIALYKKGNYTGCIQHLFSYNKKHPNDAFAFYYMGLAYSKIGKTELAKNCFQKSINCDAKGKLLQNALIGRDCITGGQYCHAFDETPVTPSSDPLDTFINAPYSDNGFSPELEQEYKQQQLENLRKQINKNMESHPADNNKSEIFVGEKLAMAPSIGVTEPSDKEVLQAIDVLKRAGVNITTNSEPAPTQYNTYPSSAEIQQLNMMLGNNNNTNSDPMMNLLPYMMNTDSKEQKIDPQVLSTMMTSSMLNSLNSLNYNDNK